VIRFVSSTPLESRMDLFYAMMLGDKEAEPKWLDAVLCDLASRPAEGEGK